MVVLGTSTGSLLNMYGYGRCYTAERWVCSSLLLLLRSWEGTWRSDLALVNFGEKKPRHGKLMMNDLRGRCGEGVAAMISLHVFNFLSL